MAVNFATGVIEDNVSRTKAFAWQTTPQPEPRQRPERANQNVENMLTTWLLENKTEHWSQGLRFIQFMKNTSLHCGIKRSPYEAIFGNKPKIGLKTSNIPLEVTDSVTTEEDLGNVINSIHADNAEIERSHQSEIEIVTETEEVIEEQLKGVLAENHDNGQEISYPICSTCFNPVNEEGFDVGKPCSENIYSFCTRNKNIAMARKAAHDGLELQAKRMEVISDSTHPKPKIGSSVRIPVPDVDRGRGDARSVLAVVLEATEDGFYRLRTKEGVISKYYSRSEFSTCPANILKIKEVSKDREIPLRSVATAQSTGHGQGFKKCNCKGKCQSKKCAC